MDRLEIEIRRIAKDLEAQFPGIGTTEHLALEHLNTVLTAIENGNNPQQRREALAQLNHFWLNRVPWCSNLSKDLEKLIIMAEEY